jgi:hypothetical protein
MTRSGTTGDVPSLCRCCHFSSAGHVGIPAAAPCEGALPKNSQTATGGMVSMNPAQLHQNLAGLLQIHGNAVFSLMSPIGFLRMWPGFTN